MIASRHLSKFLIVLTLAAAACGGGMSDNGSPPPGGGGGDGGGMISFAQDVQPIFNSRCSSCHNSTLANGGLDLSSPGVRQRLIDVPTSCNASVPRVKAGDPPGSMLWRKTKPDPSRCGSPMPLNTAGLGVIAADQFAKIETWIQQGALDN